MTNAEKQVILDRVKIWFNESIAKQHIINTEKLKNAKEFNINPFLAVYLANFLSGTSQARDIAKALILPRVLGTSITTSFGTQMQRFTNDVLSAFGSTTAGIDIEFIDQLDGRKKYCQLKAGPNTINKDDVETIAGHFNGVIKLARTNNQSLAFDQMIVGVIYGCDADLSSHYKRITSQYHYPVIVGNDFWKCLTGDDNFYHDMIDAIGEVAIEANFTERLNEIIDELARNPEISKLAR